MKEKDSKSESGWWWRAGPGLPDCLPITLHLGPHQGKPAHSLSFFTLGGCEGREGAGQGG